MGGGVEMIETIYKNKKEVICDNCGEGFECNSFQEALEIMKSEGWTKRIIDGAWKHFCAECSEEELEKCAK